MENETGVQHRRMELDGASIFYRQAGPDDAPVLLLPHGYPSSSYAYRALMPALANRWRTVAPDFPGCGYSGTPAGFEYDFDGYAAFLERFADALNIGRYTLWLHDFGSQIGLRLAIRAPERVAGIIIQNGDIYEDALGPRYAPLREHWSSPTAESRAKLVMAVSEEGFRDEFLNAAPSAAAGTSRYAAMAGRASGPSQRPQWPLPGARRKQEACSCFYRCVI